MDTEFILEREYNLIEFRNVIQKIVKEMKGSNEDIIMDEKRSSIGVVSIQIYHRNHDGEKIEFVMFHNQYLNKQYKIIEHIGLNYLSCSYYDFHIRRYRHFLNTFLKKILKYDSIKHMISEKIQQKNMEKELLFSQLSSKIGIHSIDSHIQSFLSDNYHVSTDSYYLPYSSFRVCITNTNTGHTIYIRDEITHFTFCLNYLTHSKTYCGKYHDICKYIQKYFPLF